MTYRTPIIPRYMEIQVNFTVPGFHRWPAPRAGREYLASLHRHLFYISVGLEVFHEEREVEFHDFLDFCMAHFPGGDLGDKSCETLARCLLTDIENKYPNRRGWVGVSEDGEMGVLVANPAADGGQNPQ